MHKLALRAIAKLTRVDIQSATATVRVNPIMDSEIHIEEELINLKESLDSYHQAAPTLRRYPNIRLHVVRERRLILQHCIGLVERMLAGRKLPYSYTRKDIDYAVRRLVQLIVDDCRHTGRGIDEDIMEIFKPFMSVRQRIQLREWGMDLLVQASQWPKLQNIGSATLRRVRS
jgi:hypothetical protein